jgi:hypothetical protein
MTEDELKSIAEELIREAARDVGFLTIVEEYDGLSGDDAERVYELINEATIKVEWK